VTIGARRARRARTPSCGLTALRRALRSAVLCGFLWPSWPASAQGVVDDSQHEVRLARAASRIVSLAPGITELLFDMGVGDRVVAVSEFSDTPAAALALPRVARAQGIDLEAIAALRPELIVVWGSGYPASLLEALAQLGFPVYVYEPRALESIATSIQRLGILTGSATAPTIAAAFRARLLSLRQRYEQRPAVRVFYQIWANPIMTLSGKHVTSEMLRICGGRNVFADLLPLVATVDVESVLAAQPQVIVTSEPGGIDRGALQIWRRYPQLPAVANGHLVTMDADQMDRQTTRTLDATEKLCADIERARP
jgi:iron complex transport system substrate-binding protein